MFAIVNPTSNRGSVKILIAESRVNRNFRRFLMTAKYFFLNGTSKRESHGPEFGKRRKVRIARIVVCTNIFLICLVGVVGLAAAPAVELSTANGSYPLGTNLEILIDDTARLSFEEIQTPAQSENFKASTESVPAFGYTDSVIWSRFSIDARSVSPQIWYLEMSAPPIYDFRVYHRPIGAREWQLSKVGSRQVFSDRPMLYRNFVFPLELHGQHEFYTRMKTGGSAYLPLTLWNPIQFAESIQREQLFFGVFFGILLVMALYNFFLLIATRQINYLYYVLYISSFGLAMFTDKGLTLEHFWPNFPRFNTTIELVFYNSAVIWGLIFCRKFLQTHNDAPLLNKILIALTIVTSAVVPLYLIGFKVFAINLNVVVSLTSSNMVLFTAAVCFFRGYKPARLFLLAFAGMLLGIPITALKLWGVLESNLFTDNVIFVTWVVEAVLLSFALADQISFLREARREAEKNALAAKILYSKALVESQIVKYEKLKKSAQPHYLLNSLNAMVGLIDTNPRKAESMVLELSEEFRKIHTLSDEDEIPLAQELSLCENHLRIMGMRKMKTYELQTEGLTGEECIPPLIIHTMIENALIHQELQEKQAVSIRKRDLSDEPGLEYVILTRGPVQRTPGMRLALGVGIRYIRARLEEAYPGRWQLKGGPTAGGWKAIVRIRAAR